MVVLLAVNRNNRRTILFTPPVYHIPTSGGEWELVQELLRPVSSPIVQEFLLHYYISAKSWPLVLLIGRPGMGQQRLFQLLTGGIAGCSDGQIRLLPAQFGWRPESDRNSEGQPGLSSIQGRFNTMAYLDMLADATTPGNEGMTYFLGLEEATPQEMVEYMELYLTNRHEEDGPPPLPVNLYLTAVVPITGGTWCLPDYLLDRVGIVEVTMPLGEGESLPAYTCPPVGWQRLFLRSTVREPDRARRRLQSFELLGEFHRLLAALPAGLAPLDPALEEGLLLYTANAFTAEGEGLLDRGPLTNLRQAIDLQLAQRLLPCVAQRAPWTPALGETIVEQLDAVFPRAHVRVRRILLERNAAEDAEGAGDAE
jgi:hypothetical protein